MRLIKFIFIAGVFFSFPIFASSIDDNFDQMVQTPSVFYEGDVENVDPSQLQSTVSPFDIVKGYTNQPDNSVSPHIIAGKIMRIADKCPSLKRGVSAIESIYENAIPTGNYDFRTHKWLRRLVLGGQMSIFAAGEIVKCLSIYYRNERVYGDILTGIYLAKAGIWTYSNYLDEQDAKAARGILLDFSTHDAEATSTREYFNTDISGAKKSVLKLSGVILDTVQRDQLSDFDMKKLNRLIELKKELTGNKIFKNICFYGGKALSTLGDIALGCSVIFSGQDSKLSYWLTLVSTGLDSFFEDVEKYFGKVPSSQEYMITSEMLFLCKYFSEKISSVETV